jgi:hypothetical protein
MAYAPSVSVTSPDALQELRRKYREMLAMRLEDAASEDDGARSRARTRMARLASRFPGALREIDDLELEAILDRILRLDATLDGLSAVEPWMEAIALFHALARGALWAKRWLAGRRTVDSAMEREYAFEAAVDGASDDALEWAHDLGAVACPPRGRLTDLVFERLACALGITHEQARLLVFGRAAGPRDEGKAR